MQQRPISLRWMPFSPLIASVRSVISFGQRTNPIDLNAHVKLVRWPWRDSEKYFNPKRDMDKLCISVIFLLAWKKNLLNNGLFIIYASGLNTQSQIMMQNISFVHHGMDSIVLFISTYRSLCTQDSHNFQSYYLTIIWLGSQNECICPWLNGPELLTALSQWMQVHIEDDCIWTLSR